MHKHSGRLDLTLAETGAIVAQATRGAAVCRLDVIIRPGAC
jgi:hypothetical protein